MKILKDKLKLSDTKVLANYAHYSIKEERERVRRERQ